MPVPRMTFMRGTHTGPDQGLDWSTSRVDVVVTGGVGHGQQWALLHAVRRQTEP